MRTVIVSLLVAWTACVVSHPHDHQGRDESSSLDPAAFSAEDIIERDVVIVGGGSSGCYTAVSLRDLNKSVVVIEKKGVLGGHAETYVNPFTGYTTDIGVVIFHNIQVVLDYFAKFNTPLFELQSIINNQTYVDFTTGQTVDFQAPTAEAFGLALQSYAAQLERHPDIEVGFDNLDYPVDPDLLLSFGDFVEKYGLGDMVSQSFLVDQGYTPFLDISMLYIFKYMGKYQVRDYLDAPLLTTEHHNIQELYTKITKFLGPDALLNTNVIAMERKHLNQYPTKSWGQRPIRVLVQTPSGPKLILAKALVTAAPPVVDGLTGFDLSREERRLFKKFRANGYYTGILNNTGLSQPLTAADPSQPYGLPVLPGLYNIVITPDGLTQVYYGSPSVLPDDEVKADIISRIRAVQRAQGIKTNGVEPDWLIFSNHSPFNLMVSNDEIEAGFYKKLTGLQGQRNTFYHGAAWQTQDSSVLWEFTNEYILPRLLEVLE
ncbi:amine oxidase, flavin-containing superfamily [Xylaria grammica]|nr:amine oxidase, flavin-containing superfamily [Xylaria grammica]